MTLESGILKSLLQPILSSLRWVWASFAVKIKGPFEVSANYKLQAIAMLPRSDGEYQTFYNQGVEVALKNWTSENQLIRGFAIEQGENESSAGQGIKIQKSIEVKPGGFFQETLFFGVEPKAPAHLIVFFDLAMDRKYPIQFGKNTD